MYKNIPVIIVAAMSAERRVIGRENSLLWHVPADMQRFKQLTLGHPVIMGRKTFASILNILGKPLPKRPNIVLTRDKAFTHPGIEVVYTLENALATAAAHQPKEIHIGGGSELYQQALPYTDRLYLTLFHDEPAGDAFFPDFTNDFEEVARSPRQDYDGTTFEWVDYKRSNTTD